jgi:hypothetical protein
MAVDEYNALGEKGSSIITVKFYGLSVTIHSYND